jgi:hypothetical protein
VGLYLPSGRASQGLDAGYPRFSANRPACIQEIFVTIRFISGPRTALALALFFTGFFRAHAQAEPYPRVNPRPTEQAASPDTLVPSTTYQSVFVNRLQGVEPASDDWKKSNATAGQFKKGHSDLLKWEEAQAPRIEPAAPAASKP